MFSEMPLDGARKYLPSSAEWKTHRECFHRVFLPFSIGCAVSAKTFHRLQWTDVKKKRAKE